MSAPQANLQTITKTITASWLLANRERLNLTTANNYLIGRLRVRTPLGAAEFLQTMGGRIDSTIAGPQGFRMSLLGMTFSRKERQESFDWRVQLAATKMGIYRQFFPREYATSQAPSYSVHREHELYQLINERLFPIDKDLLAGTRGMFLPMIPVQGTQQHDWENGCCGFRNLQTVFKVALLLSGRVPNGWQLMGLDRESAPPLDAPAWTFFVYSLAVEGGPLKYLVDAFNLTCYATTNPWLDTPGGQYLPVEWSAENVAKIYMLSLQAIQINQHTKQLNAWLDESPKERVGRAVELWNAASAATAREDGRQVYV